MSYEGLKMTGLDRYNVRWVTEDVYGANNTARLVQTGWEVYDWRRFSSVQKFEMSEKEQATALCKLLNSIDKEGA